MSVEFRSSCAEIAAPPSPTEPTVPTPATAAIDFAVLAAAFAAATELAGTRNENILFGLSAEATNSCSGDAAMAAAEVEAAEFNLATVSFVGAAAVSVRMPIFEATMVGAMPLDAVGAIAAGAGVAVDEALEAVCSWGWPCALAFVAGFSSARLSASAAKIATANAHKILNRRPHLPLNCSLHRTSHNGNALASTLLDSSAGVRVASRTAHHNSDLQDVKRDGRESPGHLSERGSCSSINFWRET